jgi:hypothetical protein
MSKLVIALLLFVALLHTGKIYAQQPGRLDRPVTIHLAPDSLIRVLLKLQQKTGTNFSFDPDLLRKYQVKEINADRTPLRSILQNIVSGTRLNFAMVGNDIVITAIKPEKRTIHGHVADRSNGEVLIGATVYIPELKAGVLTNQYGFYALNIPEGDYEISVSNLGYQTKKIPVKLREDYQLEVELAVEANNLSEVKIQQPVTPDPLMLNEQSFTPRQLKRIAYYAGEPDAVKALQMQNGIKAISEGSSGLFIRGGNSDQNLIILDEAVIYNPSHLYGLVSVFNPDAINSVQVYKDFIPANFGGRLSSVIENRMAEGNKKEFHVNGGINLMSARIAAEGPIIKDKSSFIVAFRRSLLDVFHSKFKLFNPSSVYYDINAKVNYKLDTKNNLFYSVYGGQDHLLSDNSFANNWGNITSTLRWNHLFNSRLFMNVSAIYSNYSNLLDLNSDTLSKKSQWRTGVKDLTFKADFTYYHTPENLIKFGMMSTYHRFIPGENNNSLNDELNIAKDRSLESAVYYNQQISVGRHWEFNYGLRLGMFRNAEERLDIFDQNGNRVKQEDMHTYLNPEPRLNISYLLAPKQRFSITYNRSYQYLQLIQNSTLAFSSLEPWIPASGTIRPQHIDYFSAGYWYVQDQFSLSANGYLKKLYHQLDLAGHAQIIQNPDIRSQLETGNSTASGIEMELKRTGAKLSATVAYTYARVFRTISGINEGRRFAANYDIPHELKVTAAYNLTKKLSLQSFFTWSTGRPLTLPTGYYQHDGINVPIFEGRNTSRFSNFSRLDISGQYQFSSGISKKRMFNSVISAGVYNLYNRKNPLYYHLSTDSSQPQNSSLEYAFGFYPWIAYSFKI